MEISNGRYGLSKGRQVDERDSQEGERMGLIGGPSESVQGNVVIGIVIAGHPGVTRKAVEGIVKNIIINLRPRCHGGRAGTEIPIGRSVRRLEGIIVDVNRTIDTGPCPAVILKINQVVGRAVVDIPVKIEILRATVLKKHSIDITID
jgi:hypothetical protein